MTIDPASILQKYWGYTAFRPLQADIIQSVLSGHDTLALLPTGGGKSLCFQVPALMQEGVCLVISPLIALMKDQVENLRARHIKADAIYSGMSYREIDRILDNTVYGDTRFLYLSPERLTTELFRERMKQMKVSLLAVDEAHCISQWGYDFRPEYLRIAEVREWLPQVPVLALTASATELVVKDIQEKLLFTKGQVFRKSFERSNLHYHVRVTEDKQKKMVEICRNLQGTGIVYVRNRRSTRELATLLNKNKVQANFYHAGLTHKERSSRQNSWKENKTRVMVCTNAFGMGIDKPDVRFVVHYEIPDGLESYYQEAGRAGRDEQKAFAVLLFNKSDQLDAERKSEQSIPDEEQVKRVYAALGSYFNIATGAGAMQTFAFDLAQFASRFKLNTPLAFNCLKVLEQEELISLSEAIHEPSRMMFVVNNATLYAFQVANAAYDPFIKIILRLYGGMFDEYVRIHEEDIAAKMKVTREEAVLFLRKLQQYELVDYIEQTELPKITFIKERLEQTNLRLNKKLLRFRKEVQTARLKAMIGYASQFEGCRSRYLLQYFDETKTNDCGQCDVCINKKEHVLTSAEITAIAEAIKTLLLQQPMDAQSVLKTLGLQEKKVTAVLQLAIEYQQVVQHKTGLLSWNSENESSLR